jgi:hypothetical protein
LNYRWIRRGLVPIAVVLVAATVGCGGDGSSDDSTQQSTLPAQAPSDSAFPTSGTTTGPDVVTTPGHAAKTEPGQAGGGSGATCIGC